MCIGPEPPVRKNDHRQRGFRRFFNFISVIPEVEPFLPFTGHDAAKVSRGAQTVTPHANSFVRGTALIKNNRDPLAEKRQQAQQVADADDGQDVWPV